MIRLVLLFFVFTVPLLSAQEGNYKIEFELENYSQNELIIGYYYGQQTLVQDTLRNEAGDGKFVLQGTDTLEQGIYLMLTVPDVEFIQFIVDENKEFTLRTDGLNLSAVTFEGSEINTKFYDYLGFVKSQRLLVNNLRGQKAERDSLGQDATDLVERIDNVNKGVKAFQLMLKTDYPESLLTMLIEANTQIDVPDFEGTDEEIQIQKYKYYKAHYFDKLRMADPRTLRTPFLHERIDYYVNKLTAQIPDSVNTSIDEILSLVHPATETYRYYLSYFLNTYHNSKLVGFDAVYVHVALKYYGKEGETPWVTEENLEKILDKARRTKPLLIGKQAPDFTAEDSLGNKITLSEVDADYTVLMFWKPSCGHCEKAMPHVVDFAAKYKDKGVEVVTFCTEGRKEYKKCWESVKEKNMQGLINLGDESGRSRAQSKFYSTSTPMIYIMDRSGEIIMKRIGGEQLETVMDEIIRIAKEEKEKAGE